MKIMEKLKDLFMQTVRYDQQISYNYPTKETLRKIYTKFKKIKPKKNEQGEPVADKFLLGLEPYSAVIEEVSDDYLK